MPYNNMSNDLSLITMMEQLANFVSVLASFCFKGNDCTHLGIPSFLQSRTGISLGSSVCPSFNCSTYFSINLKVLLGDSCVWLSKAALQSLGPCSVRGLQFAGWCSLGRVALAASAVHRTRPSLVGTVRAGDLELRRPTQGL